MSFALWPVFEDGQEHSPGDEGAPVFRAYKELDAIAVAAGHMPLEAFDEHADVPAAVVAQLAEEARTCRTSLASRSSGTTPLTQWQPLT